MILDLFSHKIHSSGDEWPDKLVEIAAIFYEFDGQSFNRDTIEQRLQQISPRVSYLANMAVSKELTAGGRSDASKFRDEISAYPAYLGLYYLEPSPVGWVVRITETAKRFLIREEPDVASFLRLQLPLFQYPNAMGATYKSHTNNLRIQANARDRTLEFIRQGVHFSPVRTIAVALQADARLRDINLVNASVSYDEIFGLANYPLTNKQALPAIDDVASALDEIRNKRLSFSGKYERRFHTLKHTEIFMLDRGHVSLRNGVNEADRNQLVQQLEAIASISAEFTGFDNCTGEEDLKNIIASGQWGRYFDGVKSLPSQIVETLTKDEAMESSMPVESVIEGEMPVTPIPIAEVYPYEYRYRYRDAIDDSYISLCLVLPENPTSIPWITDYLCIDREINICWFDEDGKLSWPEICEREMQALRS